MRRLLRLSRLRMRRGALWLWRQEGTPGQRARGLAAGVFCGCYPFFGLQIFLSVGVATVVRGNHLLAAAGTLVSNPLTYLPLYWFNYLLGCQLLGPGRGGINLAELNRSTLWTQGWDFTQRILLGSTVVGMVLAIASGWMAYRLFLLRGTHPVVNRSR
ncbi:MULTISPECIES: DUF2062 domain-containing protein [unclassified Synechococcus]|uniref:DUF2062 domain-containing protein n=1 Tax=unclassified Synechococcus TaxID=2626047 RepID=UPI00140814B0|nr:MULTISPECIES: DUF2062 domain-containing protein [unclassified Synechococcus]